MLLTSTNHFELALHVVGYQYPDNADDKYDSNWLYVDVRLRNSHGIWRAIIPHLLTWEVRHLAAWLRLLADGQPVPERMGFIEPALVFALDRRDDQALTLWVWFLAERTTPDLDRSIGPNCTEDQGQAASP